MKDYLARFVLLCIVGTALSCKPCPANEIIGEARFSTISKSFLPYIGTEILVFQDSAGNEVELVSVHGLVDSVWTTSFFQFCAHPPLRDAWYMVEQQILDLNFENDSISFDFSPSINLNEYDEVPEIFDSTCWTELFSLALHDKQQIQSSTFIVKATNRNGNPYFSSNDSLLMNHYFMLPSINFIDSTYYNIFSSNDHLWYNKTYGVVAFKYHNRIYELKRIE